MTGCGVALLPEEYGIGKTSSQAFLELDWVLTAMR